jgi:hypothetical protein
MRLFQRVAASIAFSALMAASATCGGAEDAPVCTENFIRVDRTTKSPKLA